MSTAPRRPQKKPFGSLVFIFMVGLICHRNLRSISKSQSNGTSNLGIHPFRPKVMTAADEGADTESPVVVGNHHNKHVKQLGTIIILAPPRNAGSHWGIDRFCLFLRAVRSVNQHLNCRYGPYPIHVLVAKDYELDPDGNDGLYTNEDRALIRSWAPNSTIEFVEINMYSEDALEPGVTLQQAKEWKAATQFQNRIGYASMCRLWSGRLQQMDFLQGYQYYMRMDDDSLLVDDVKFDPFVKMKEAQLVYSFRRGARDNWGVQRLWETARPFINVTKRTPFILPGPKIGGQYPKATYLGVQPYNNFHVSEVAFWTSPKWKEVWNVMNREHLFFQHRVGDANVHAIACMLIKREELTTWSRFPYRHNSNDMGENWVQQEWRDECAAAKTSAS